MYVCKISIILVKMYLFFFLIVILSFERGFGGFFGGGGIFKTMNVYNSRLHASYLPCCDFTKC